MNLKVVVVVDDDLLKNEGVLVNDLKCVDGRLMNELIRILTENIDMKCSYFGNERKEKKTKNMNFPRYQKVEIKQEQTAVMSVYGIFFSLFLLRKKNV